MDMTAPERILVRAPNWVGDVVMTTPGLRALRYGFPDAQIVVQIRPGLEGLLSSSPHIDEVIHVESYHRGFAAMVKEGARLRSLGSFDLGICSRYDNIVGSIEPMDPTPTSPAQPTEVKKSEHIA